MGKGTALSKGEVSSGENELREVLAGSISLRLDDKGDLGSWRDLCFEVIAAV